MTFEEYVADWDKVCAEKTKLEAKLKPLKDKELAMRKAISESLSTALGATLREGVNTFVMQDGRSLKYTHEVKREVEKGEIANARAEYEKLNDRELPFDMLLRQKYELDKAAWKKLTPAQQKAVSRMLTTKLGTPTLEII